MDIIQVKDMAIEKLEEELIARLTRAGIRVSPVRLLVLKTLMSSDRPLSSLDIETGLETVDRSSITRTLSVFTEAHIVHVISDGSGSMKYEVCADMGTGDGQFHSDGHAHFHCRSCGETVCLPSASVPEPELPEGFRAENATYVITGLCPSCNRDK